MSKIIQALEKAKLDGGLSDTVQVPDERATLEPAAPRGNPGDERDPRPRRGRRNRSAPAPFPLGTLPAEVLAGVDQHVETLHRPMSLISEQYRSLRNRLERLNVDGGIRVLAVTSSVKGEGKSLTAANLAAVMAQDPNKRILLVDADLRRPRLQQLLGVPSGLGLAEFLHEGKARYEDIVRKTPLFGLHVVTAGNAEVHPAELLASEVFFEFLARARQEFDYVVVDTPPLHPVSDVRFLTEGVDGVILVVRAGKTSKSVLKQAAECLPAGKILGTVLNRVDPLVESFGYRYSKGEYYYRYY